MKKTMVSDADRSGVIAVPPLCRAGDGSFDWAENDKVVAHLLRGGVTRLMYGGNAFVYHLTLAEYGEMLAWLSGLDDGIWCVPGAGPSFGRLMDQAALLRKFNFPCAMALPCADPRDAAGLETGLRRFSSEADMPVIVYLKQEGDFGADRMAGLDAVARLVDDGVCVGVKYAVVRHDAGIDPYLAALLERVDRRFVISGIGERPAIAHLKDFGLPGFTSGSVCVAPAQTQAIFDLCKQGEWTAASELRQLFLPHEDLRDGWGPARVLHASVELAGIARTGPVAPFLSGLSDEQMAELGPVAKALYQA